MRRLFFAVAIVMGVSGPALADRVSPAAAAMRKGRDAVAKVARGRWVDARTRAAIARVHGRLEGMIDRAGGYEAAYHPSDPRTLDGTFAVGGMYFSALSGGGVAGGDDSRWGGATSLVQRGQKGQWSISVEQDGVERTRSLFPGRGGRAPYIATHTGTRYDDGASSTHPSRARLRRPSDADVEEVFDERVAYARSIADHMPRTVRRRILATLAEVDRRLGQGIASQARLGDSTDEVVTVTADGTKIAATLREGHAFELRLTRPGGGEAWVSVGTGGVEVASARKETFAGGAGRRVTALHVARAGEKRTSVNRTVTIERPLNDREEADPEIRRMLAP